ncbi:NADH-quinone oxidoreductase subunit L [Pontibacter sp. G13]|uniref:NADH-quinone oxidoreductase subunit L n=1 Tax=Pontibacter sp. G13 TaxID=3074898 RepID=UPI00288A4D18|nr:NADH-quinone oxidoreductase subunit L [Pontibacter sp. G13]WNJ16756.1 NADH-quinone oxidoreductase subunit L [Pontibacter sp. G13]
MEALYPLIILLPLLGSAIIGLVGFSSEGFRKQEGLIGSIGTFAVAIPFFLLLFARFAFDGEPIDIQLFTWMEAGNLSISFNYRLDELSFLMGMIVTGVGSLIHMYSIGYMHGDSGYYKFFAYLNLFIFAMLNLILSDNMAVMFLGWEGVGVCSYLLIGFWFQDMAKAKAAQKAFIANRIGDFAFLVAMFMIFTELTATGETTALTFTEILDHAWGDKAYWICLLLFIAATGKSAQIPLFVWLPDAMAGPTPVSALIHAATMVTSGIYMIARLSGLYLAAPEVLTIIVVVAALTSVMAAFIAVAQNDIKGVLAYSTVSQLGFMFMALGAGAFTTAIFHVMTHAFFKACLFLGSGSVIHAMEHMHTVKDPQDIRTMGGLRKYMPSTSKTFWISTLAISGIPLLSGFFSKDEILSSVFFQGYSNSLYFVVYAVAFITAALTAFYMTRVTFLTFNGKERFPQEKHPHESPAIMTIPLWILAILAVVGGYVGIPALLGHPLHILHVLNDLWLAHDGGETGLVANSTAMIENMHHHHSMEYILLPLSAALAIFMVWFTFNFYKKNDLAGDEKVAKFFGPLYPAMQGKFYIDELYNRIFIHPFVWIGDHVIVWFDKNVVDGIVNGTGTFITNVGDVFKRLQTGLVSNYVVLISLGVVAILAYLIFG